MANRERGEVAFDADGASWTLRYSTNALCDLEDVTGRGAIALAKEMEDPDKVRITTLRAMFWAGLRGQHPQLTIEAAGNLIGEAGINRVGLLIGEAFQAAFPEMAEAGGAEKGKPTPGSTGTTSKESGPRPDATRNSSGG